MFHAFPENHYLYLPRFDGEYDNITAERHMQNFETFLNLFEVDEGMSVSGYLLFLFKEKSRVGSKNFLPQASQTSHISSKFSSIGGWSNKTLS